MPFPGGAVVSVLLLRPPPILSKTSSIENPEALILLEEPNTLIFCLLSKKFRIKLLSYRSSDPYPPRNLPNVPLFFFSSIVKLTLEKSEVDSCFANSSFLVLKSETCILLIISAGRFLRTIAPSLSKKGFPLTNT